MGWVNVIKMNKIVKCYNSYAHIIMCIYNFKSINKLSHLIIFNNLDYVGITWQEGWYQFNYIYSWNSNYLY